MSLKETVIRIKESGHRSNPDPVGSIIQDTNPLKHFFGSGPNIIKKSEEKRENRLRLPPGILGGIYYYCFVLCPPLSLLTDPVPSHGPTWSPARLSNAPPPHAHLSLVTVPAWIG
uniref:Uncharacterized protein n=1 Tax=Romanomermis culicivorax TaxID=13658 RepID=A0A915JBZ4_ROMCU